MAMKNMPGDRHGMARSSGRSYPWMLGGIIIGAVIGFISGMAQANVFTRELFQLIIWALGGALLFSGVLGGLGWAIDNSLHRPPPT